MFFFFNLFKSALLCQ